MLSKNDLKIVTIASKDSSRPILEGVHITALKRGNKNLLRLAATDGYKLLEHTIEVSEEPDFSEMLIPAKELADIGKLMKASDLLLITEKEYIIHNKEFVPVRRVHIGVQTIGAYPEYAKLIPGKSNPTLILNRKYLIDLLSAMPTDNVEFSYAVTPKGLIDPIAPLRIDTTDSGKDSVAVLMPLKQ